MSILDGAADKRHFPVPTGQEFVLDNPELPAEERTLRTLDDLSEAINLIDPETFQRHVNAEKNDFANWVQHVFGEDQLAEDLRKYPTPLRMMVSIEKFLRQAAPAVSAAPSHDSSTPAA
jgi:hypothetical protein